MIRYSTEEGFIKPHGIKFRSGQDSNIVLPEVAIGVFSRHLFEDTVKEFNCQEVGYISCANLEKNIYILKYNGTEITFFMAGVGSPLLAGDIEELSHQGVKKFIIFGNCGVLDNNIPDCSIIIPTKSFRDEGTSYHYVEPSDTIDMNPKYQEEFIHILKENSYDYIRLFLRPKYKRKDKIKGKIKQYRIDTSRNYSVNLYAGIWTKEFIRKTLFKSTKNAWQYEVTLSRVANKENAK